VYSITQTTQGRFLITHPRHPGLAWSELCGAWTPAGSSFADRAFPIVSFDNEQDADDYATDHGLYPRRD
jgi:hypothetical protein